MQQSRFYFRGSVFPALSATSLAVTASLSVALTYRWQTKWRQIERIPFVSDAHYDSKQSPIFSVMLCLSAFLFFLNVAATHMSMRNVCFGNLSETDGSSMSTFRRLARISLGSGYATAVFMVCTSAFYVDLRIHSVAAGLTALGFLMWAFCIILTLRLGFVRESFMQRASYWLLPCFLLTLLGSFFAIIGLFASHGATLPVVVLEYVSVGLVSLFLLALSYLIHPVALILTVGEEM